VKKFVAIVFFSFLAITSTSHAIMKLGVNAGMNQNKFAYESPGSTQAYSQKNSMLYGAQLNFDLLPVLDFIVGLRMNEFQGSTTALGQEYTLSIKYVEIPAFVRFHLLPTDMVSLFLDGGLVLGSKSSAAVTPSTGDPQIESSNTSLLLGFGAGIDIGIPLQLAIHYQHGITDVATSSDKLYVRSWAAILNADILTF